MSTRARLLLGNRLRDLLAQRRINQSDLAKALGKSQPMVSQVLAARRGVSTEVLDDLAKFFGVEVADLFLDPLRHPDRQPVLAPEERLLVEAFRDATLKDRRVVAAILDISQEQSSRYVSTAGVPDRDQLVGLVADVVEAIERRDVSRPHVAGAPRVRPSVRPSRAKAQRGA